MLQLHVSPLFLVSNQWSQCPSNETQSQGPMHSRSTAEQKHFALAFFFFFFLNHLMTGIEHTKPRPHVQQIHSTAETLSPGSLF